MGSGIKNKTRNNESQFGGTEIHSAATMVCRTILLSLLAVCSSPLAESLATNIPVWFDSSNDLHRDLRYHPEQPERITACVKALSQESCVKLMDIAPNPKIMLGESSTIVESSPFDGATLQRARDILLQTHDPELVTNLETACHYAKENRISQGTDPLGHMGYIDSGDTYVTTESWGVILRATAAWMQAVDQALESGKPTFALTRPPGHHATRSESNGFCLVNFAAAAALHALKHPQVQRVSILDWDVHYGQGVADIVKGNSNIRYVSTHQVPSFPYMGQVKEIQDGNILTLPMPADTTWTCGYQTLFDQALDFVAGDDNWQPDLVIVCAGYDALGSDDLASCSLTAADFGSMTRALKSRINQTPLMFGLEGGYQLQDAGAAGNLQAAVVETVRALSNE